MVFNLDAIRRDTPAVENLIHLNNAGAALMPRPVVDALKEHLDLEAAIGGYEAESRALAASERSYDAISELINCQRDEIAMVENATVGWQMAFYGLPLRPGDRILTAETEYAANVIAYLQTAKRHGVSVEFIPSSEDGDMDITALENMLDNRVKLISISHIPTNGGLINPAKAVGDIARKYKIPYLLDACQSVGQIPVDVEDIGCDMMCATGRKYLRGPRGTGFLYVRKSMLDIIDPPFLDLHGAKWTSLDSYRMRDDARRFENWEFYVAGKIGLGVAVDYLLALGIDETSQRLCGLAAELRNRLCDIRGISTRDIGTAKGGIVTFDHGSMASEDIERALVQRRINCSTSTPFSTRFDMEKRNLGTVVRTSVHYYNTMDEIEKTVATIREIVA